MSFATSSEAHRIHTPLCFHLLARCSDFSSPSTHLSRSSGFSRPPFPAALTLAVPSNITAQSTPGIALVTARASQSTASLSTIPPPMTKKCDFLKERTICENCITPLVQCFAYCSFVFLLLPTINIKIACLGAHSTRAPLHTHFMIRRNEIMEQQSYIKSIFKNGEFTREEYTRKWIELITLLEEGKHTPTSKET